MNFDPLAMLNQFQQQFFQQVATVGGVLWPYGFALLSALVAIMTVFVGYKIMYHHHHPKETLFKFSGVVLLLWIIMQTYTTPSALLGGNSFSQLIPTYAAGLAAQVDSSTETTLVNTLNLTATAALKNSDTFSLWNLEPFLTTITTVALVGILELAMFLVVAFGYLALGVVIGIGPILIPFLIVPKLDFLFWGWLKAMIKYSFYPVAGKLFLLIICQLLTNLIATASVSTLGSVALTLTQELLLAIFLLVGIYGVFKIPTLITDIFNGASSTGDVGAAAQQAVRMATSLA
jgi:hypothetical protein